MSNEIDPDGVTPVPTELLESPHLTAENKLVYVILAAHPKDVDVSRDKQREFAAKHGITEEILVSGLLALKGKWIELVHLNNDLFSPIMFAKVLHRP